MIETTDRAAAGELITMTDCVDVIVPRGGKGLIERISRESLVPVIKHLDGVCHVYLDAAADRDKALAIAINAKTQRFGTCNTMETLLVAEPVAAEFLGALSAPFADHGVEIRGCERSCQLMDRAVPATENDWREEYLGPVLAVRVVADTDAATDRLN